MKSVKNIVLLILCSFISVSLFSFLYSTTDGFKNWDNLFNKTEECKEHNYIDGVCSNCGAKEDVKLPDVEDEAGNSMISGVVYEMPENMYLTSITADSSYASNGISVIATVLPEDATNKELTWSVFWENSTGWASGKNVESYLTYSVENNICTIKCLAPFGESIILKAASVDNPSIAARCTIDYLDRAVGFYLYANIDFGEGDATDEEEFEYTLDDSPSFNCAFTTYNGHEICFDYNGAISGVHSLTDNIDIQNITYYFSDDFIEYLEADTSYSLKSNIYGEGDTLQCNTTYLLSCFNQTLTRNQLVDLLDSYGGHVIDMHVDCSGDTIETIFEVPVFFTYNLAINVESVNFNKGSLTF